jgi:hypothetical protein
MCLFKQYFQYGYWKNAVIQKHGAVASWRHLIPGAAVLGNLLLVLGIVILGSRHTGFFRLGCGLLIFETLLYAALAIASGSPYTKRLPVLLLLAPACFIYHTSYGSGFLLGFIHFGRRSSENRSSAS